MGISIHAQQARIDLTQVCPPMLTQTLARDWQFRRADQSRLQPATVPGCVHTDLLALGLIPDPFLRDNELPVLDVAEHDWVYRLQFTPDAPLLQHESIALRCEGLDTLATLTLNGTLLGETSNMFRTWEFDIKPLLKRGRNTLEITFAAAHPAFRRMQAKHFLPGWMSEFTQGGQWLRKMPCAFGWDWGPRLVSCGIWKPISLVGWSTARLADVAIAQDHLRSGSVRLAVNATIERSRHTPAGALKLCVRLVDPRGHAVEIAQPVPAGDTAAALQLTIAHPELWWPNGMGAQPLYRVEVQLLTADDAPLDVTTRRIGLRRLELVRKRDKQGETFHFSANGVPFFAKGANWIPADSFPTRLTRGDYARLLQDAAAAHMNMLRSWGGGIYESDAFFDLCDELGLCVWQDFIFACMTYPAFDATWMDNVREEVIQNVRRLRHHPSLALWCGNNELEMGLVGPEWNERQMSWADYSKLFDTLLPELIATHDPARAYWPCSPHTSVGERTDFNSASSGDVHFWEVWHRMQPFEWYLTSQARFISEFGFQSFPEPATVRGYTAPADRNITSPVMELHQRSGPGNAKIIHYMLDWFRLPCDFDMTLWLSQILQGIAIQLGVEHWRRSMPFSMGALYWQLNDCWPVASWASIDYHGRWKALHYLARRFFAPVLASGFYDPARHAIELHGTSDLQTKLPARLTWKVTDLAGKKIAGGNHDATLAAAANTPLVTLDAQPWLKRATAENLVLWYSLKAGTHVSENALLLAKPKRLELPDPALSASVAETARGELRIKIQSQAVALWAWIECPLPGLTLEDNFFHLAPGRPRTLRITQRTPHSLAAIRRALQVHSLYDTYAHEPAAPQAPAKPQRKKS
jgi:beta-mannosidase